MLDRNGAENMKEFTRECTFCKKENKVETVRDLLCQKKPIHLMTPCGYVNLSEEIINRIIHGETPTVLGSPDSLPDFALSVELTELLNYRLVHGGYNDETGRFEYLVG